MSERISKLATAAALTLFLAISPALMAQQAGTIVGFAYDASNGNPLSQVEVEIAGPVTFNVKTDTEGGFMLEVPAGSYVVNYTSPHHSTATVEGITITAGEVTDASTVMANPAVITEIEVVAEFGPEIATAETMLVDRKLASTVSDSISGAEISSSTASDAAGALEAVTGVSVVDDSYVYVRGLGERYSSTTLNNSMLATTEPERRVVPLDLFPANLIDNIKVLKTYSPDLSGEFSAGLVQIETVEFPSKPTLSVSYSMGFNSRTQGQNFLTYPGGGNDFWGFDDGTRDLPVGLPSERIDRFNFSAAELQDIGRLLPANWARTTREQNRPSMSWNVVAGNTYGKFGIVAALTFANKVRSIFDQDRIFYRPNADVAAGLLGPNDAPPTPNNIFKYDESKESARLGGVVNLSYRFNPEHKIALRNFISHDNDNETRYYEGFHQDFRTTIQDQRLRWIERQVLSTQLEGEHLFPALWNSIFSWQVAYSKSSRYEPDLRENVYLLNEVSDQFEYFDDSQSAFRMTNDLDENLWNPAFDWSVPFYKGPVVGSIKVGVNTSFRQRDFLSRRLRYALRGSQGLDITNSPNILFAPENIRPNGFEVNETTRVTDAYAGDRNVYGYFGMVDLAYKKWRLIGGLRVEDVDQNVESFDPFNPENRKPSPFTAVNYLPAANAIYQLTGRQNLRFGVSQTVSRPDFRELALFDFLDVVGGRLTVGNPDLIQTDIRNYDVRWEYFPGGNQLIAASFFYKNFNNPIERTVIATVGLTTTFSNATAADNYGVELEFRRNLDFVSPALRPFSVSGNFTFVDSNIDLTDVKDIVLTSRERPMQGQSRYIGNAILEWAKPEWRSTTRFYANYYSSRITDVGSFGLPDVLQAPLTTLDLVYELSLVGDGKWKMRFSAENLTDAKRRWTQGGELFQGYTQGQTYSIGTSYQIF
ncbi:MAG: outer membrane beta-barrel protein [Acidobacteria bacterium]|nr:outer membrane beta-barrel protein [Acidobacteriota bacterium]